jgi:hypothetical protein
MLRRVSFVVLLVFVVAATSGCKKLEEQFTPPPKVVTRDAKVAAPSAEVSGTPAENMPEGLVLWPGAEVVDSKSAEKSYELTLQTSDKYAVVLAGVVKGFEDAGWSVAQDESGDPGAQTAILTVTGAASEGFVTIADNGDGTVGITYVLSAPAE